MDVNTQVHTYVCMPCIHICTCFRISMNYKQTESFIGPGPEPKCSLMSSNAFSAELLEYAD